MEINNKGVKKTADKFYFIVSIIMIIIFLVNGLLVFFYSRIFYSENKDKIAIETLDNFSDEIMGKTVRMIEENIQDVFHSYFLALKDNPGQIRTNKEQIIGFRTDKPEPEPLSASHKKDIELLKRHGDLLKTMISLGLDKTDLITNTDIRKVQEKTHAKYKGKTLIRHIHQIANAYGFENVKNR